MRRWYATCSISLRRIRGGDFVRQQQSLGQSISCSGVGLHTGLPVTLTLRPAPPDTGIVFVRHGAGKRVSLGALVQNLVPTELCTAISLNGTSVKTIEHVLAALVALEDATVFVEPDSEEVPSMVGSSNPLVRLIKAAGVVPQERRQPFLKITQPIEVADGVRSVIIDPSYHHRITYSIQYDHPLI